MGIHANTHITIISRAYRTNTAQPTVRTSPTALQAITRRLYVHAEHRADGGGFADAEPKMPQVWPLQGLKEYAIKDQ